jgi:hypothetical protein
LSSLGINYAIHPWFDWFEIRSVVASAEMKSRIVHRLAHFRRLSIAVRLNGKSAYVSRNHGQFSGGDLISTPIDTNAIVVLLSYIFSIVTCFAENTYAF